MGKYNARRQITEVLTAMPDLTSAEISALLPELSVPVLHTTISYMRRQGIVVASGKKQIIKSDGVPYTANSYSISDNPVPLSPKMKLKKPTPAGYEARIEELNQKIEELEQWKAAAIDRFPDLAVPPLMVRARKIAADEVRAGGDTLLANQIMSGLKDSTLMVRVALKALEEGE